MRRRFAWAAAATLLFFSTSCSSPSSNLALSDEKFQELSIRLSEEPGYFDTDNLISNETSFQHVVPALRRLTRPGQAYIGVGPDQNFTYIAAAQPSIGFLLDVRRDNLLLHLYFKALFERSQDRWDFLCRLFGEELPLNSDPSANAAELVQAFSQGEGKIEVFEQRFALVWDELRKRFPGLVQDYDRETIHSMAESFFLKNLDLRFQSHGRRPRASYPTLRDLILETDLAGQRHHFLEKEEGFQFVKSLHRENRLIPVIGDLGGKEALRGIARELRDRQLEVAVFYASNVEFYLFQQETYPQFAANIRSLPIGPGSIMVRSHFGYWGPRHPARVPGYPVTSLAQRMTSFLEQDARRPYEDYEDVVRRDYERLQSLVERP